MKISKILHITECLEMDESKGYEICTWPIIGENLHLVVKMYVSGQTYTLDALKTLIQHVKQP